MIDFYFKEFFIRDNEWIFYLILLAVLIITIISFILVKKEFKNGHK
jgi:hypothetical protein